MVNQNRIVDDKLSKKSSEFSRMNTKEWKIKTDKLMQHWESAIFEIEMQFEGFVYELAREEQQEMRETSGMFNYRLEMNKEKINEFKPLTTAEIDWD